MSDDEEYWNESKINRGRNRLFNDNDDLNAKKTDSSLEIHKNDQSKTMDYRVAYSAKSQSTEVNDQKPLNIIQAKSIRNSFRSESNRTSSTKEIDEIALKTEISTQKAELQYILDKREEPPDMDETIKRIITNKPYWFDLYKSKTDKIRLLDKAIESCDGNAILAVVHFIKRTLLPDIFLGILMTKPVALNHYIYYLEQTMNFHELNEINKKQSKISEASVYAFRSVLNIPDDNVNGKIFHLNSFKEKYPNTELALVADKYIRLIDFQKRIEKVTNGRISFKDIPKPLNLNSTIDTLYYCLLNYQYLPRGDSEFSIEKLKSVFELTNKQYACVFIKAMAELYAWSEIERFTSQRGMFNNIKKSCDIPWECVASIINTAKGPLEELGKYVKLIDNMQVREQVALKYKLHDIVIEIYQAQNNKQAIVQYATKFAIDSNESILCRKAIEELNMKRKN